MKRSSVVDYDAISKSYDQRSENSYLAGIPEALQALARIVFRADLKNRMFYGFKP